MDEQNKKSIIPNTTQVPNFVLDELLPTLSDVELRIVLIVTRQTLGWVEDKETGRRKDRDWISAPGDSPRPRLVQRKGRAFGYSRQKSKSRRQNLLPPADTTAIPVQQAEQTPHKKCRGRKFPRNASKIFTPRTKSAPHKKCPYKRNLFYKRYS